MYIELNIKSECNKKETNFKIIIDGDFWKFYINNEISNIDIIYSSKFENFFNNVDTKIEITNTNEIREELFYIFKNYYSNYNLLQEVNKKLGYEDTEEEIKDFLINEYQTFLNIHDYFILDYSLFTELLVKCDDLESFTNYLDMIIGDILY